MESEHEMPFIIKSKDKFENGLDQIFASTKYRDELDKKAIDLPAKYQMLKAKLFNESKVVTKFINDFYKTK